MLRRFLGIHVLYALLILAAMPVRGPAHADDEGEQMIVQGTALAVPTAAGAVSWWSGHRALKAAQAKAAPAKDEMIANSTSPFDKDLEAQKKVIDAYEKGGSGISGGDYQSAKQRYQDLTRRKQAVIDFVNARPRTRAKNPLPSDIMTAEDTKAFGEKLKEFDSVNKAGGWRRTLGKGVVINFGLMALFQIPQVVQYFSTDKTTAETIDDGAPKARGPAQVGSANTGP